MSIANKHSRVTLLFYRNIFFKDEALIALPRLYSTTDKNMNTV